MRYPMAAIACWLVLACATEPKLAPIIGPDGAPMFHLTCAGQESRCYELAGARCPSGYDLVRTQHGRDTFLLRCRAGGQVVGGTGWAPRADLAPSPYSPPAAATSSGPEVRPVPVTTVPAGYPPLAPGPGAKDDIGY